MCGIAGLYYNSRECVPERDVLARMVRAIHHRGPDGQGFHVEPGVGLGHARLSIIDLTGGAQPMHNEDATVWITYNGEVFNYIELREWLIGRGHTFATHSDTEVIVHLYEELGDDFVGELNGQFAFALWDRRRGRLLLVRDRAGILPLYYARTPRGLVFASEVKALIASGHVKPELDAEGLDELMTFWAPVAPRTVFKDVQQVRPGEFVVFSGEQMSRHQYWSWDFPDIGSHRRDQRDALKQELVSILDDATRLRLRADVPVGAYLSGGLDSSSLVALLKSHVPETLHTFSIGFDDAGLDESAHQLSVAGHLHTQHHPMHCTGADIARGLANTVRHTESPILRTAPTPMRLLSGLVRHSHIRVVLTGEGADEVLGGYDIFKEAKVRQFWARNPNSSWRPALLKRLYPYLDLTSHQSAAYLREFFSVGLDHPEDPCFAHLPRWATTAQCKLFYSDDFRSRLQGTAIERYRAQLPQDISRWHAFNRAEYVEANTLLPSYLLSSQGDRMLMANSIEGRFPFLDHRLIQFANHLHPTYKMRVMREKQLLKEAMRARLPPGIIDRHKQPYRAPDAAAFLGENVPADVTELVNALTSEAAIREAGCFDAGKVARLVAKIRRTRTPTARDNMAFIGVLSTQLWHAQLIHGRTFE